MSSACGQSWALIQISVFLTNGSDCSLQGSIVENSMDLKKVLGNDNTAKDTLIIAKQGHVGSASHPVMVRKLLTWSNAANKAERQELTLSRTSAILLENRNIGSS
jgi:hypothetical protein